MSPLSKGDLYIVKKRNGDQPYSSSMTSYKKAFTPTEVEAKTFFEEDIRSDVLCCKNGMSLAHTSQVLS